MAACCTIKNKDIGTTKDEQLSSLFNHLNSQINAAKKPTPALPSANREHKLLPLASRFEKIFTSLDAYAVAKSHEESELRSLSERFAKGAYNETKLDRSGDEIFNDVMKIVTEFHNGQRFFELRPDQWKMFSHIMSGLLPFIYGKTLEENKERVMNGLGVKEIYEALLCVSSRRVGKTTVIGCICAALMICVPKFKGVIFAPSQRGSSRVRDEIVKFLSWHPRGRELLNRQSKMKRDSVEKLVLVGEDERDIKEFEILPASAKPDIFSLVEASGVTRWKDEFEEKHGYQSYYSPSPYSYFYICWREERFKLIKPIISHYRRYVGVILEDIESSSIVLYISVHLPNKNKKEWQTFATHVLETYKQQYYGHVVCIIAGDFNNKPHQISPIFSQHFSLGIGERECTTEAGNSIDNILLDKPHDFGKTVVLKDISKFTHYPIISDIAYYN